jgi:hypothetical protein
LNDALLKIQNGAGLQYPESNPADAVKSKQFLLDNTYADGQMQRQTKTRWLPPKRLR